MRITFFNVTFGVYFGVCSTMALSLHRTSWDVHFYICSIVLISVQCILGVYLRVCKAMVFSVLSVLGYAGGRRGGGGGGGGGGDEIFKCVVM